MNSREVVSTDETGTERSVSDLYTALTEFLLKKKPETLSIHRGLWGPDTKTTEEGLERANRTLAQGCDLGPGKRVLDAGCGVGGTAIALAQEYGVRVTGLTNCGPHVDVASQKAQERGVGHLVEFLEGDFMELPFAEESFDAVLNQESFCYAVDKPAYLRGVYRVLKPGGRWRALDVLRCGALKSEAHRALIATLRRGWRLPPFLVWRDVRAMLEEAGFTAIANRDLTAEALRWREKYREGLRLLLFLNPQIGEMYPTALEFMNGSICMAEGLSDGVFSYNFYSATRPER